MGVQGMSFGAEHTEDAQAKARQAILVTCVGAAVNIVLSVLKIWVGLSFSVHSVMADGLHSFSDLVGDAMLIVFVRLSARPRSRLRPYGYRKWETLATLGIALLLLSVAVSMLLSTLSGGDHTEKTMGGFVPLAVILVSIAAKEALYWYTVIEGRRMRSPAVIANAWHHRSDALSSVAVLFCLVMSLFFGKAWLWDLLGVAMVSMMIIKAAWDIGGGAFRDLLDYAPAAEVLNRIEALVDADPDVRLVRDVRARTVSGAYEISLCVEVDGAMTVSQGHEVTERVEGAILEGVPGTIRVVVHVEPTGSLASRVARNGIENIHDEDLL
jgi:cation diffusion facilitator family transporter